jgi:hypothetical protein
MSEGKQHMHLTFWISWGIDALIGVLILYFFFLGLSDGSVSSFNIGIWTLLLGGLAIVMGGSLWLRSKGRPGLGVLLLMILAIPGLLYALFLLVVIISGESWN